MNNTIQVSYRWSVEEMILINKLHMQYSRDGRKLRRIINFSAVAFLLFALLSLIQRASRDSTVPFLIMALVIWIGMPFATRRAIRKAYARKADRGLPITYELSNDRLISRTEIATVESPWRTFQTAIHTPEGFLLYVETRNLHWLPNHGFSNTQDMEQFVEFARTHIKDFSAVSGTKPNTKTF